MSQRKEKYLRRALAEANRLEGAAVELAAMGKRLEQHQIGTDRRLAANIRDTQQLRDEVRRQRRRRNRATGRGIAALALILATVALILSLVAIIPRGEAEEQTPPADSRGAELAAMTVLWMDGLLGQEVPAGEEDPQEAEKITAALLEQGYLSDKVPLSYEDQDHLQTASEEGGAPYPLALAVIEKETNFTNVAGDGGDSIGYMQVAPRWHGDRMERLGVTDLWDPYGNFRVGCDFLGELLDTYGDTNKALMVYNMGPGRAAELWEEGIYETQYSREVMERAEAWATTRSDAGGTPGC